MINDRILKELSPQEILGLTIYGEARGESIEGQVAVGCVIRNRMSTGKYVTFGQVCLENEQFSCWNENDPNYSMLMELADKLAKEEVITNSHLRQCLYIAAGIKSYAISDNTNGARHYVTKKLLDEKPPDWAIDRYGDKTIGNHVFFNIHK